MLTVVARPQKSRLDKIGDNIETANRFSLFRTGNALEGIQKKLIHLNGNNDEILTAIGNARETLEDEHSDVGTANRYQYRKKRGLVGACALLATMVANIAIKAPPDFLRNFPSGIKDNFQMIIAGMLLVGAAVGPARDFIFSEKYGNVRFKIQKFLEDLEKDIKKP
ncbi:hypothetical protein JXA56_04375 [Candidatus Micrarchaeota archaeon]|nr:hypothetical protein [Candidatus Micrarchaeota archaeon]